MSTSCFVVSWLLAFKTFSTDKWDTKEILSTFTVFFSSFSTRPGRFSESVETEMENMFSNLNVEVENIMQRFNTFSFWFKHPVSVPRWGLLDSPGKMSKFQKFCGVRPRSKFSPGRQPNPTGVIWKHCTKNEVFH